MTWLPFGGRTLKEFEQMQDAIEQGPPYPWWSEEQKKRYADEHRREAESDSRGGDASREG